MNLEHKFCAFDADVALTDGATISGYASVFGKSDQGGDMVAKGAYTLSLAHERSIKMLWQHDPMQPIGIWDEIREDERGLWVKGRLLTDVAKGREAASLVSAGAIDGLSIGYRTVRAQKNDKGGRLLSELELWEVSLVTFPMLPEARVDAKGDDPVDDTLRDLATAFENARRLMARE